VRRCVATQAMLMTDAGYPNAEETEQTLSITIV
jgi:hypothetical protein